MTATVGPETVTTAAVTSAPRRRPYRLLVPLGLAVLLIVATLVLHAIDRPDADEPGFLSPVATDDDGSVLGYAGLAVSPPDEAWVQNVAVRRDAQRRGIGRLLLEALLAEAARRGARSTLLEVAADNAPAQRLYAGYGFEPIGVRRGYYQPSNTDALVMQRNED